MTPQDVDATLSLLVGRLTTEEILALRPSDEAQSRLSDLLAQSKAGTISGAEKSELDRYLMLEHLVRLAKAQALQALGKIQDQNDSPPNVEGVALGLTSEEILQFIHEGRRA